MEMIRKTRMINLDGEYHKYYKVFDLYGRIEFDYENMTAKYTAKNDWDDFSGEWEFRKWGENREWHLIMPEYEYEVPKSYMEIAIQIIDMIEELWDEE